MAAISTRGKSRRRDWVGLGLGSGRGVRASGKPLGKVEGGRGGGGEGGEGGCGGRTRELGGG